MDRMHNAYGTPKIILNPALERSDKQQLTKPTITLNARQRQVVENAVREVCNYRQYVLRAVNVRTNHAHVVASAMSNQEPIMNAFKSYSTRALRKERLITKLTKPWARHGSTIYVWKEEDVAKAVAYVLLSQGDELFTLDDWRQADDALANGRATAPCVPGKS
jgi:REP element-mobilizing transposase RayT